MNLISLFNIILSGALCLKNTFFIQTCTISFTKISFIQAIKYPYLVNLFTIINKFIKQEYFITYIKEISVKNVAQTYIKEVFLRHGVLAKIILDKDTKFILAF